MRHPVHGSTGRALWVLVPLFAACTDTATSLNFDAGRATDSMSGFGDRVDMVPEAGRDGAASPATDAARDAAVALPHTDSSSGDASDDAVREDARVATDAGAPLVECNVTAPNSCPSPAPTYADVAMIINRRCESCHSPRWTGPWPLDTYQDVADWQDTLRSNMLDCSMPPLDSGIPMTNEERLVILSWLRCGLPQ